MRTIKEESKLIEQLTTISIQLNLAVNKQKLTVRSELFNTILFQVPFFAGMFRHRRLFSREEISIQSTLVSLARLGTLAKRLEKLYLRALKFDNEIFKPSRINQDLLIEHLNKAIGDIENNNLVASSDKQRLINYIVSVKVEISGEKPNWNKAIGALVIVATLLGGVAVAPQAYDNVTKAIQHVLGVSIEKHIPNMLLSPKKEEQPKKDSSTETIIT